MTQPPSPCSPEGWAAGFAASLPAAFQHSFAQWLATQMPIAPVGCAQPVTPSALLSVKTTPTESGWPGGALLSGGEESEEARAREDKGMGGSATEAGDIARCLAESFVATAPGSVPQINVQELMAGGAALQPFRPRRAVRADP